MCLSFAVLYCRDMFRNKTFFYPQIKNSWHFVRLPAFSAIHVRHESQTSSCSLKLPSGSGIHYIHTLNDLKQAGGSWKSDAFNLHFSIKDGGRMNKWWLHCAHTARSIYACDVFKSWFLQRSAPLLFLSRGCLSVETEGTSPPPPPLHPSSLHLCHLSPALTCRWPTHVHLDAVTRQCRLSLLPAGWFHRETGGVNEMPECSSSLEPGAWLSLNLVRSPWGLMLHT